MQELNEENKNTFNYHCEKCNLGTNSISIYNRHLNTVKHKGKRDKRCDKKVPDNCPHCDYSINSNYGMKAHILNHHSTKEQRKEGFKFYCEKCDVGMWAEAFWDKHLKSKKHIGRN